MRIARFIGSGVFTTRWIIFTVCYFFISLQNLKYLEKARDGKQIKVCSGINTVLALMFLVQISVSWRTNKKNVLFMGYSIAFLNKEIFSLLCNLGSTFLSLLCFKSELNENLLHFLNWNARLGFIAHYGNVIMFMGYLIQFLNKGRFSSWNNVTILPLIFFKLELNENLFEIFWIHTHLLVLWLAIKKL